MICPVLQYDIHSKSMEKNTISWSTKGFSISSGSNAFDLPKLMTSTSLVDVMNCNESMAISLDQNGKVENDSITNTSFCLFFHPTQISLHI